MLSHIASSYLNAGFETGRYGTAHHSIVPYQVSDTHVSNWAVVFTKFRPPVSLITQLMEQYTGIADDSVRVPFRPENLQPFSLQVIW